MGDDIPCFPKRNRIRRTLPQLRLHDDISEPVSYFSEPKFTNLPLGYRYALISEAKFTITLPHQQ